MKKSNICHLPTENRGGVFEPCVLRLQRTEEEKKRRHLYGDKGAKFRKGKQYEPMTDGCSRTITTFSTDNILMEQEKIVNIKNGADLDALKKESEKKHYRYRIRKLTSRECLRLMAVRDSDIDKIQSAGISESRQYQLAGNSIVVDCLVNGIFKNLFIENDKPIETLF